MKNFKEIFAELQGRGQKKRMVAAWGVDTHTIAAAAKAVELGLADVTLVGDQEMIAAACAEEKVDAALFTIVHNANELSSIAEAVQMVREGQGDFLMKGLCSTDKFLRAILNKETGLLPPKGTLTHCTVLETPAYHKLLFVGDVAVIPAPDFKQKQIIMSELVKVAKSAGISLPKVAIIAPSMPKLLYPIKVAILIAKGPGVDSDIAIKLDKSLISNPKLVASSLISGIIEYPPPKVNSPILKKVKNNLSIVFYLLFIFEFINSQNYYSV